MFYNINNKICELASFLAFFLGGNDIGVYPNVSCHPEQREGSRASLKQSPLRDFSLRSK